MSDVADFSSRAWWFVDQTFGRWMDVRIRAIRTLIPSADRLQGGPLLFVPNHTSFWDGFIIRRIQKRLRPDAPLYSIMLEDELERRPFLRRLGGMGIRPGDPRSFRTVLNVLARRLEARPDACVAFFPQGRIWPSFRRPLGFHSGVRTLVRRLPALRVLPTGLHLEGHNRTGLTAYVSVGDPLPPPDLQPDWVRALEQAVEAEIDGILDHVSLHGEDGPTRWPPRSAATERAPEPKASGTQPQDTHRGSVDATAPHY